MSASKRKIVTGILVVLAIVFAVLTILLYLGRLDDAEKIAGLEAANTDLYSRISQLEFELHEARDRLEREIAGISSSKEKEISDVRSTYDELVVRLQEEIAQGEIKITRLADRLSVRLVDRILFPSGEAAITEEGRDVLKRVGSILAEVGEKRIRVEGHTDNVPISRKLQTLFPSNWELSTTRASNVVRFLSEHAGVEVTRLEAVGLSEYHPVAGNDTEAGRSQNRRIEILLLPEE